MLARFGFCIYRIEKRLLASRMLALQSYAIFCFNFTNFAFASVWSVLSNSKALIYGAQTAPRAAESSAWIHDPRRCGRAGEIVDDA